MEEPLLLESDKKPIHYLSTIGIIKSAIKFPLKSPNFLIFTILTSLPFISADLLQKFSPFSLNITSLFFDNLVEFPNISFNLVHDITLVFDSIISTLQNLLFPSLNFLVAIATVHSTSKIYTVHRDRANKSTITTLFHGLSTFMFLRMFGSERLMVLPRTMSLFHGITVAIVEMILRCSFTVMLKVGFVFTVLEEKDCFRAFSESSDLLRGNWKRGTMLMVCYEAWRVCLALPILFPQWDFRARFGGYYYDVFDSVMVCFGIVMNWVVCVIYYYDCKNREMEEENGLNFEVM